MQEPLMQVDMVYISFKALYCNIYAAFSKDLRFFTYNETEKMLASLHK